MDVTTDQVIAFRLNAHHLTHRSSLLAAAGACGIQNSPPGSALLALHARVPDMTAETLSHAVATDKTLLQTWSLRGAPFLFPTEDAGVFTTGVLPSGETEQQLSIVGVRQALATLDVRLTDVVALIRREIGEVLAGRELPIGPLGAELAERIAATMPAAWRDEGPHAPGQPLGEAVVHFCLRILTLQGVICFAERTGTKSPFALVTEWLGGPLPKIGRDSARAELARRYLRCHGPSTQQDFASWSGVHDAGPWWRLIADEIEPVRFGGREVWILAEDRDSLKSPPDPHGVRLLPPRDPYIQLRDRGTIVAEQHHREIWRTVGEPGTVLADGRIVASWRARKKGRRLTVTLQPFRSRLPRPRIDEEAQRVAVLRGCSDATVVS